MSLAIYYLNLLPAIREVAKHLGYAIGVHGSMVKDFDLIAAPWVEDARSSEELAEAIRVAVNGQILPAYRPGDPVNRNPSTKPHGRIVYTILLSEGKDARYIDLSIMMPRRSGGTDSRPSSPEDAGSNPARGNPEEEILP